MTKISRGVRGSIQGNSLKRARVFLEQQIAHIIHLYLIFTGTRLFLVLKQYGAMTKLLASSEEESMVMQ